MTKYIPLSKHLPINWKMFFKQYDKIKKIEDDITAYKNLRRAYPKVISRPDMKNDKEIMEEHMRKNRDKLDKHIAVLMRRHGQQKSILLHTMRIIEG